eukprot:4788721-Alexandrium_andersonii.AAC.1
MIMRTLHEGGLKVSEVHFALETCRCEEEEHDRGGLRSRAGPVQLKQIRVLEPDHAPPALGSRAGPQSLSWLVPVDMPGRDDPGRP